jgi:hypothetical protein
MVRSQNFRAHLNKLPYFGKIVTGSFAAAAALVAVVSGVQVISGHSARAQIALSERTSICKDIYNAGNGYWRTMVQFSLSAAMAGELSDQQVARSLKEFHPELQSRYMAFNDAVVASKAAFSLREEAEFRKYARTLSRSQEVAWIAITHAPSTWNAQTRGYFHELNRSGRQNSDANYTAELDSICYPG